MGADVAWGSRDFGSQSPAHSKCPLTILMKDGEGWGGSGTPGGKGKQNGCVF